MRSHDLYFPPISETEFLGREQDKPPSGYRCRRCEGTDVRTYRHRRQFKTEILAAFHKRLP